MTRQSDAAPPEAGDENLEWFKELCVMAMQLALEAGGAPDRCPSRACRSTHRCHVVAKGNRPVCQAGIPGHVAAEAALMLAFFFAASLEDGPAA